MKVSTYCQLKIVTDLDAGQTVATAISEQSGELGPDGDVGNYLANVMADALLRLDTSAPVVMLAKAALMLREMREQHTEEKIGPQAEQFFQAALRLVKMWSDLPGTPGDERKSPPN